METINDLNNKYKKIVNELFEKVLCDKCMKEIKLGQVEGELTLKGKEKILLCKKCANEVRRELIIDEFF